MRLIWLLWACSTRDTPASVVVDPTQSLTPPAPHSATHDTAGTTEPTPPSELLGVEPSVRIVSPPGMTLGASTGLALLAGVGLEPSLLLVGAGYDHDVLPDTGYGAPYVYTTPLPHAFYLAAHLPRGTHAFLDVWDGVSGSTTGDSEPGRLFRVPDVTGDGIPDLWQWNYLLPGPLLGRTHTDADRFITLSPRDGSVVLAGFDADGDGHDDILTRAGSQQLTIRYGPFTPGPLPSFADGEVPADQVTLLGEPSCDVDFAVTRIPDLLGPGRDVVAHGGSTSCPYGFVMYELLQPRGLQLPTPVTQVRANIEDRWVFGPIGDVDGDDRADFLATMAFDTAGLVLPGPPSPVYDLNPWFHLDDDALVHVPPGQTYVRWSVGDLNGDGVEELIGQATPGGVDGGFRWALSFSPHEDPIRFAELLAVSNERLAIEPGELHADLDGDGLQDIVSRLEHPRSRDADLYPDGFPDPELVDTSEIVIWYGADLLAAENARRVSLGLEPFPVRTR